MTNERQFLRQQLRNTQAEAKALPQENKQLRERLAAIEDVLYRQSPRGLGRAAPTVDEPGQTILFAGDQQTDAPAEDDESEPAGADEPDKSSAPQTERSGKRGKRGGRLTIPDHLERETIVLEPDTDTQEAIAAGLHVEAMEPVVTERLDYVPGRYLVKRYERPRYGSLMGRWNHIALRHCHPPLSHTDRSKIVFSLNWPSVTRKNSCQRIAWRNASAHWVSPFRAAH